MQDRPLRVLVVDDDPEATGSLCRVLDRKGYRVHEVNDSRLALEAALEFQPHVVILDFLMPNLHGGDVAGSFRAIPIFETLESSSPARIPPLKFAATSLRERFLSCQSQSTRTNYCD